MSKYTGERISTTHQHQLYLWTATINSWKHLLAEDSMKIEIIQSLQWLKAKELISVCTADAYCFSSASFYQTDIDEFGLLTHIGAVL